MKTQGKLGFFYKGKCYVCHNDYDLYPNLDLNLLHEVLETDLDEWITLFEKMKEIEYLVKPTSKDIEKLENHIGRKILKQGHEAWCSLKEPDDCENVVGILKWGYLVNIKTAEMCKDFAYQVDLDNKEFLIKGDGFGFRICLEKEEEMMEYANEWSSGL